MCYTRSHQAQALQLLGREHFFMRLFEIRDIDAGTDISFEDAVGLETRNATIQNPAVFIVCPAHPVLHRKWLVSVERRRIRRTASLCVIGMYVVRPAVPQLLLRASAGEVHPPLVDKSESLV